MRSRSPRPVSGASQRTLRRLLSRLIVGDSRIHDPRRGRLVLESLEKRQLLAGDMDLLFTDGVEPNSPSPAAETSNSLPVTSQAEGELAPDLVQFAIDLKEADVLFYGANWCPACTDQKELFGDGKDNLPFVEVTGPDRQPLGEIKRFPTWEFPDGSRVEGVLSLATISQRSGVPIPQSETPTFEPIGVVVAGSEIRTLTIPIGSPIHIPVDAYDPDGGPLAVTISVDNSNLVEATVLPSDVNNRSIRIDMATYGDMVFKLFEQEAPVASRRVIELAQAGFYDGIIFHRVVPNFVIQAGDPGGDGRGGSDLSDFDDDFNPDLQHNVTGVLSFAKTNDDTNNSQFFITEGPQRHLDFNHSVFGMLVEGNDVREAISNHQRDADSKPTIPIAIETIEVFTDTENSLIRLKAAGNSTGSTNATITVRDQNGHTHSQVVRLNIVADTANSQPFLNDIATPAAVPANTPALLQLSSVDVEGVDAVTYFAQAQGSSGQNVNVSVNPTTGLVTVTPNTGFAGTAKVLVGVEPGPNVLGNSGSDFDSQLVTFTFEAAAPTTVDLLTSSDSGLSSTDNITNQGSLTFAVTGVTAGAFVELVNVQSGAQVGQGTANGTSINITTANIAALGDGTYQISARQTVDGLTSEISTPLNVVYDTISPAPVAASAATQANVDREFVTDLISAEEGSGLRYALSTAPTGTTINATTGLITWTPSQSQVGENSFTVELTDVAGNVRTETFAVNVAADPLAEIRLQVTDLAGNEITSIAVGQEFLLNFIGADVRGPFDRNGIYGAFADILFDSSIVRPVPGSPIDFADKFTVANSGTFSNGLIDELGAVNSSLAATGDPENLIATIRMEALGSGTVNIRSEPAEAGSSEVLLFGNDERIPAEAVAYGSVSLAVGQSFTVANDTDTVLEDSAAKVINVLANDKVVSGSGTLRVVSVTQPNEGGTVTLESGVVRFRPNPDFFGQSVFTYRVSDSSNGVQESASVTITVTGVNDPPTARDDSLRVNANSSGNSLDVLDNDLDDGTTLTITGAVSTTTGATVRVAANGQSVLYTPPAGFTGPDKFTYTISDGSFSDTAEVTVTVAPVDPPPTAKDDSFDDLLEDAEEAVYDILNNDDTDASDEPFLIIAVGTPSAGGTASFDSDGSEFLYAPAENFHGIETVSYTIRDIGGGLSTATVTFTVAPVNDAPPISSPTIPLNRATGETSVFGLADLPDNVDDNETLTFKNLGTPTAGGTVRVDPTTGAILYTPPSADFVGEDSFTYAVEDDFDPPRTSSGKITINVTDFTERSIFLHASSSLVEQGQVPGIRLIGTDAVGNAVDRPITYGDSGAVFANVLPGEYTLEIPVIPFLQKASAPQRIAVSSAPDDFDATVTADVGRLRPEFISVRDWLGSAPLKSILAVVAPGESHMLARPSSTAGITDPVVQLTADASGITIRGSRPNESTNDPADSVETVEASIPAVSDRRVQVRGQIGDLRLLRISVEDDGIFTPVNESSAESEFIESTVQPEAEFTEPVLQSTSAISLGGVQAEGESFASTSVSQADLFVPVASNVTTRSDVTVLPLASGDVWVGQSLNDDEPNASAVDAQRIDAAMTDVAPTLTIESPAADLVAERSVDESALDHAAIDSALLATE